MKHGEHYHCHPQVLLLGNGINRAFGGGSWGGLIRSICCNPDVPPDCTLHLPMPLRAILVTGDCVDSQLRGAGEILYGKLGDPGHAEMLRSVLDLGFDHILTTNFSYELEQSARPELDLSDALLRAMTRRADGGAPEEELKYLLHSYCAVERQGRITPVWHIHGEGRKSDSIILGHYYYANLLERITTYLRGQAGRYAAAGRQGTLPEIRSWADAFLVGDVYMLGFGCDVSEFDLWWLLNRKKKEPTATGQTHFFAPEERLEPHALNEKEALLRVLGVKIHHCGMLRPEGDPLQRSAGFRQFYLRAIAELRRLMAANRGVT